MTLPDQPQASANVKNNYLVPLMCDCNEYKQNLSPSQHCCFYYSFSLQAILSSLLLLGGNRASFALHLLTLRTEHRADTFTQAFRYGRGEYETS